MEDFNTINKTLGQILSENAVTHSDTEFIVYADRDLRFTYKEFNERVDNLALGLHSIGIRKGDHVGIWATNVPDWTTFMFATAKLGAILVTVNTNYKSYELEYLVKQSDLKALAIVEGWRDSDYISIVNELIPELRECQRGHLKSEKFPCLETLIFIGQQKHRGMFNTAELILVGSYSDRAVLGEIAGELDPHDVVNMQYTSGTTGFPKGVMLTHFNIVNNGFAIGECQKLSDKDRILLPVPLFHCFGCVLGVMAAITHQSTLVIMECFDPLLTLASVQKERCTALYGVPTMFIAELHHPMFRMFDLSSLRTGIMSGSPCPMETMKQVMTEMHCPEITIPYGLTEASPVMTQTKTDDPIEVRVNSVGRNLPGIEVAVFDPETGSECQTDEIGEICCRGYNVMKGYYKMPEATAQAIDKNGWLHSGDLGKKDENGFFSITGRIKDMIIRGGENVYPREIENLLLTMPGIKDVQVVGVPSKKYGEQVGAFIKLKDAAVITEEDVTDYCRNKVARFKIPKYIFFIDEYPMTASGKIQKYKLREMSLELLKTRGVEVI
ncbi:MAG: AMP-binding protein [Bacteroidota bacterium]